jgi:two-component system sensor histidine kinase RegB
MLGQIAKPYQSTKAKPGHGLGLVLAVNVVRKLGGAVTAVNREEGGAQVTLSLPLSSIELEEDRI